MTRLKQSPAFQFYPGDFLRDQNVMIMDLEETGAYIRLLSTAWIDESIPNDIKKLSRICMCSEEKMAVIWEALSPCFMPKKRGDNTRLVNRRMEAERKKQTSYRKTQAQKAKKRWENGAAQD